MEYAAIWTINILEREIDISRLFLNSFSNTLCSFVSIHALFCSVPVD
jgi:hypothetical protein